MTSSKFKALSALNGLVIPSSLTIGSSHPLTVMMKLPFPGFSLLTSTLAFEPTALTILPARVRKAPHDLHASMVTTLLDKTTATGSSAAFAFFGFFSTFFLVTVGAAFAGELAFADDLVTLAIVDIYSLILNRDCFRFR